MKNRFSAQRHLTAVSVVIGSICFSFALHAAELFVHPQSTRANTFPTIQAAVNQAKPGDTIRIAPGHYRETVTLRRSGTVPQPITIVAEEAATTVLDGTDAIPSDAWTTCGKKIYRLTLSKIPHPLLLWENEDRLESAGEEPAQLQAGTFYLPATDDLRTAYNTRWLCPPLPEPTAHVVFVRPHHPRFTPQMHHMAIATRSSLIRLPAKKHIANIVIRGLHLARSAAEPARGTIDLGHAQNITLEGLGFRENGSVAIRGSATRNLTIRQNEITAGVGPMSGGIHLTRPMALTIQQNFIHDNAGPGIAIVYHPELAPSHYPLRILDNVLWANAGANLQLAPHTQPLLEECHVEGLNTLIKGNVIVGAYGQADSEVWASGIAVQPIGNMLVRENLFVGNQHALLVQNSTDLCGNQGQAKLSENIMLFSFGDHIFTDEPTLTNALFVNNLYSRQQNAGFLEGLFHHSRQVLESAARDRNTAAPATLDSKPMMLSTRSIILNGQLPFIYAPTAALPTRNPENEMTVVRLGGSQGLAKIQLSLRPRGRSSMDHDPPSLRVSLNGRLIPLQAAGNHEMTGSVDLSPWQNWLVVSTPIGWQVDLIRMRAVQS